MTSVRVRLLPSIIKAMVRASKSLVVGWWWWGGLFDYSVYSWPRFCQGQGCYRGEIFKFPASKSLVVGWGGVVVVVVACLIIVSLQVLSFENLTLNFELLSSDQDLDH